MNRYQKLYKKLIPFKKGCFIPFVVLGDPSVDMSLKIINALIENGADGLELGIPFSDPIADGEIIQKANLRAFNSKINLHKCFNILSEIREKHQAIPIGLLLYSNLIFKFGINKFYLKCYNIGIDSILIADLPIEESYVFRKYAIINNILPVFICPPDAKKSVIKNIAIHSKGYIYLLSRSGVTGINQETIIPPLSLINELKKLTETPLIQGFGISHPYQIQKIILSGVSGVICGSIIAKLIENYFQDDEKLIKKITSLSKSFKKATIIIE